MLGPYKTGFAPPTLVLLEPAGSSHRHPLQQQVPSAERQAQDERGEEHRKYLRAHGLVEGGQPSNADCSRIVSFAINQLSPNEKFELPACDQLGQ